MDICLNNTLGQLVVTCNRDLKLYFLGKRRPNLTLCFGEIAAARPGKPVLSFADLVDFSPSNLPWFLHAKTVKAHFTRFLRHQGSHTPPALSHSPS